MASPPLLLSFSLQSIQNTTDLLECRTDKELRHSCVIPSSPLWMTGKGLVIPSRHWEDWSCSLCPSHHFSQFCSVDFGVLHIVNHFLITNGSFVFPSGSCLQELQSFSHYHPLMSDLLHVAHRDLSVFHISQVELLRACRGGTTLLLCKSVAVSQLTSLEGELRPKLGVFKIHTLHI